MKDSAITPDMTGKSRTHLSMLAEVSHHLNLIETPDELYSYLCRRIKAIGEGYILASLNAVKELEITDC
jgi:hypothetical protein